MPYPSIYLGDTVGCLPALIDGMMRMRRESYKVVTDGFISGGESWWSRAVRPSGGVREAQLGSFQAPEAVVVKR